LFPQSASPEKARQQGGKGEMITPHLVKIERISPIMINNGGLWKEGYTAHTEPVLIIRKLHMFLPNLPSL
jgi:hypothetical protein